MKEIRDILQEVSNFTPDDRAVLATVIDLQGSGYRLPGARMLIEPKGTIGTVSGGCLEADVLERSKKVIDSGRAEIFTYDTTGNEESVFSMNMGCRGVIRILLEHIDRDSRLIKCLRSAYEGRETQFLATITSGGYIGNRAFLNEGGECYLHSEIPTNVSAGMNSALRDFGGSGSESAVRQLDTTEGTLELTFERISPPLSLLLFGAGADAVPLARLATDLGWDVTAVDHRTAYLTRERFPTAKELKLIRKGEPLGAMRSDSRTAVVIMTHDYDRDLEILPTALETDAFYIGVLGPKSRTRQLLEELQIDLDAGADRLYAPIGLDIGSQTPEGIALSITAEIQGVFSSRTGGHLRERAGSIYGRK